MPDPAAARARFDAAAEEHLTSPLAEGFTLRRCTTPEVIAAADALWAEDDRPAGRLDALYSEEERARMADLDAALGPALQHCVLIEHGGAVVGVYWGQQEQYGRYYMINTIIRRDVQGRGLYRALLPRVVAAAAGAGFREINSRHRADNNPILIAKLKAGFVISGFEVAPRFGLLVHLRRYCIDAFDRAFRHRIDGAHGEEMRAKGVVK